MNVTRREWLEIAGAALPAAWRQPTPADDRIDRYHVVESLIRTVADDRAVTLFAAGVRLTARDGVFVQRLDVAEVSRPTGPTLVLPEDGLLVFAVQNPSPKWVRAELELVPGNDLRPGLRATLLSDTTVVAAPMVEAEPWGVKDITDPAPLVRGRIPPTRIEIEPWLLPAGRRYLTLAGPHMRTAGEFKSLRLEVLDRPVGRPRYSFAFIADTHVRRTGREDWMNRKMGDASAPQLLRTLHELSREGVAFVMHGGDMTDRATRDEFALMRDTLAAQPLPVYGCIGNHDRYLPSSRDDAREVLAAHFPGGALNYTLSKPPLRFVVYDVAVENEALRERERAWLHDALREDPAAPTAFLWHYPPYNRGGVANSGFQLQDWSQLGRDHVDSLLGRAPNLRMALNGHDHWDEVNHASGIPRLQNAAFVEWPNTYRVMRVFDDRVEWEVRQASNRGFVRESFLPQKGQSWMIATRDTDLRGQVSLTPGR